MRKVKMAALVGLLAAPAFSCNGPLPEDLESTGRAEQALSVGSVWNSWELWMGARFSGNVREDYATVTYVRGTSASAGDDCGRTCQNDLDFFGVRDGGGMTYSHGGQDGSWQDWGGVCTVGADSAYIADGTPAVATIGTDGEVWMASRPPGGAVTWVQVTINNALTGSPIASRPGFASRGDGSYDVFYITGSGALWHTGFSSATGLWYDEDLHLQAGGGVDAAWNGNALVIGYIAADGSHAATVLEGTFVGSSRQGSNGISWGTPRAFGQMASGVPFPSVAFVGTSGGTRAVLFYNGYNGPGANPVVRYVERSTIRLLGTTFVSWSAIQTVPGRDGGSFSDPFWFDVAARPTQAGSTGARVNFFLNSFWNAHTFNH
jgi:hypothetical protein